MRTLKRYPKIVSDAQDQRERGCYAGSAPSVHEHIVDSYAEGRSAALLAWDKASYRYEDMYYCCTRGRCDGDDDDGSEGGGRLKARPGKEGGNKAARLPAAQHPAGWNFPNRQVLPCYDANTHLQASSPKAPPH